MGSQHFSAWKFSGGILLKSEIPLRRTSHLKYKGYLNYIQQKNVDTRLDSVPDSQEESFNLPSTQRDPELGEPKAASGSHSLDRRRRRANRKSSFNQDPKLQPKSGFDFEGLQCDPQVHPKEKLQVRFLCLVFMNKDLLVTGGSNGFLYIFKKGVLIEEQIGHLKSPILCIDKSQYHENFFVTGGQDGSVNLWEIRNYQDSNVIEKLFEYNIYKNGRGLYDKTSLVGELENVNSQNNHKVDKLHQTM